MKYTNNLVTIFHEDCLKILENNIQDNSIDLIFADPPYNIGKRFATRMDAWPDDESYINWCKVWLNLCISKLRPNGSMYLMASTQSMPYLDIFLRDKVDILSRIIWHYDSSGVQAKKYYGSLYEPILFCVKDQRNYTFNSEQIKVTARTGAERKLIDYRKNPPAPYSDSKVPGNVWYYPRVRFRMPEYVEHPTQKPESLLERIIMASTNPGDIVLDPFAGSFSTCSVAQKLGRRTIGIEIEESYIKLGLARLGFSGIHLQNEQKNVNYKTKNQEQTSLF
jgi:adenine-specific DNA-methyltransferase